MKVLAALFAFAVACLPLVSAQVSSPVIPATPKGFKMRPIGGDMKNGVTVEEPKNTSTVRYTAHIVLYQNRFRTNTEGRPLEAKLIAFEDLVAEVPKGSVEPNMPDPPKSPTVIRDGKIRLLVKQKVVEVTLAGLSQQDREFVDQIKSAITKKAAAK